MNPEDSISERLISGGAWSLLSKAIEFFLLFITLSISSRIIAPYQFGLIGIAYLTINSISIFTEIGFSKALIQKKNNIESYLNTAWTMSILRSIFIYIILWLIAPIISIITGETQTTLIIQIISISIILQSFINIYTVFFLKELQFRKQFIFSLIGSLGEFIITVIALIILRNLWGLVIGKLIGDIIKVVSSYLMNIKKIPKISFDWKKSKELFNFGKWLLSSSILIFFITQGDDFFVVAFLGTLSLGFYQMAYKFSNLAATQITHTITTVSFPTYSKLQDNPSKLKSCYFSIVQITLYFSFPIAGLLFIVSPEFIEIFLGENWYPIIPIMQILCVFGLTRSINATTGPLFEAVGKPEILTKLGIFQLICILLTIFPFTILFDLKGVAITVTLSNFFTLYLALVNVCKIIKTKKREIFYKITPFIISLSISLIIILILKSLILKYIDISVNFIISIFIGIIIYVFLIKIFKFSILEKLYTIINEREFDF